VPDNIDRILIPVWEQVARRYANRSDYIVYEILNEPYGISDERWGEIQGRAVDAIRRYDQKHWIIVTKAEWSGIDKFYAIPEYRDSKLIYTFHFYDPFLFTHQGASWTEPSEMGLFSNILFPYDRARMPALPSSLRGQWIEGWYRDYRDAASPQKILETLDAVTAFSRQRNVPVFCGEYGVLMSASPSADRAVWYEFVTNALDVRNISRTSWDYFGGFGMFNPTGRDFYADVNVDIARAMGFTPPAQSPQSAAVIRAGYVLYDDFINPELSAYSWGDPDVEWILFESNAADGEFAIRWANAGRYQAFLFNFPRKANLTEIAANGYLEFKARTDRPVRFDVRFLNPDNASSLPWRMNYTVNESILPPDGRWHTIRIKLSEMRDVGAWSNSTQTWHNPVGAFRWDNIESLDFTAEYMDLKGCSIYFDSIKITH
jgi:endoglucanase